jgi:cob(I)alamin adenosyltransferase
MIYVFTGNGKGKTSAALGAGLRMIGAGKKVFLVQFLKASISSENWAIKKIENFEIRSFGRQGFFLPQKTIEKYPKLKEKGVKSFDKQDIKLAKEALACAKKNSHDYDLLILDEVNIAIHFKLIQVSELLKFLERTKKHCHIILTGRQCPQEIIEKADLVTDFQEVKHYYQKNISAIRGIDF